ncbi:MAG: hypothetical protein WC321_02220 [Candidatus Omnitrophota bacterium]|jgi:hypothetical protein
MKKTAILILLISFVIMAGIVEFSYAAAGKLTRLELAECLSRRQGISLPSEKLSKDAYYNSLANALATKGITIFLNSKPNEPLTCAQAIDLLYGVAGGGKENLGTTAKIDFLVRNGYLSTAADPAKMASTCEQILCQPPVAEPYAPAEILRTQAPGEKRDNPVDQY